MKKTFSKTLKESIVNRSNDYSFLENDFTHVKGKSTLLSPFFIPEYENPNNIPTVSIIISAYNAKESILACLASIEESSFNIKNQNRLEVIVVDDGSEDGTWEIIKKNNFSLNLTAVRQNNYGQAKALNTGISVAQGNIIIFCDADMVLSYHTIDQFVFRHQQIPNALFTGFRTDTPKTDFRVNPTFIKEHGIHHNSYFTNDERIIYPTPGWPSNMCLASNHYKRLGYGRGLWMPDDRTYEDPWLLSDLVIGALFSLSREVLLAVGGYDERLYGWGSTDGLLAAKVISYNQFVIPVYAASGLHVNHPFRTKDKQLEYLENRKRFFEIINSERVNNYSNWIFKAKERVIESFTKSPSMSRLKLSNAKPKYENDFVWNEVDSLLAIGEYSEALINISKYSFLDNDSEKEVRLGKAFMGLGRYPEAIEIFKRLYESSNFKTELFIYLLDAYGSSGQFKLAYSLLKDVSTPSYYSNKSSQDHINQGNKYFDQGFYDIALKCFEAALIEEPENTKAFENRNECRNKLF